MTDERKPFDEGIRTRIFVCRSEGQVEEIGCHSWVIHESGALMVFKGPRLDLEICYAHGSWIKFTEDRSQ